MKKYYLATTRISDVWDFDSNLLILGPWCLQSKKNIEMLRDKDWIMISSPWKPAIKLKSAAEYCRRVYEELLFQLSENLNYIHQVSYPVRYWKVLLGFWLQRFIETLYDRYKRLENALNLFPDLYTHVLPVGQCRLVSDCSFDFLGCKVNDDFYNLKLFSIVAYDLCPEQVEVREFNSKYESSVPSAKQNWRRKLFYNFIIKPLDLFFKSYVTLADMYHVSFLDILLFKCKDGFSMLNFENFPTTGKKYSCEMRKTLNIKGASDKFQAVLYKCLSEAIPLCYIENYKFYKNYVQRINKIDSIKIVGSAIGWYFNEMFKFFAAEAVSRGSKLVDFQHGGGYGRVLVIPDESICLEKDFFITWGWDSENHGNIKPLPSPHLSRIKNTYSPKLNNILFIGMAMPLYLYKLQTHLQPEDMAMYFEDKRTFFQNLAAEIRNKVLYRPYNELGWGEKEKVEKICPNVTFITSGSLIKWMKRVKLVVVDHPHTSFIEALTINVPCVLFWDTKVYLIRSEAEKYHELLRIAGIVHNDPESAARKVNEIYHNPVLWWQQPEVQKAKDEFCLRFALTSKNWRKEWAAFLKGLKD